MHCRALARDARRRWVRPTRVKATSWARALRKKAAERSIPPGLRPGSPGLHEVEHRPALLRNPPSAVEAVDQGLRENVQIRNARRSGPLGPIWSARRQDCHVALEVPQGPRIRLDNSPVS
jgi:hypothetical protein